MALEVLVQEGATLEWPNVSVAVHIIGLVLLFTEI